MAVVEALSRRNLLVKRLLGLAEAWPESLQEAETATPQSCRIARQLRPDEITELTKLYARGAKVRELAERFSISRATVGQHLKRQGFNTRPPGLHPDDVPVAARLYEDGWSLARVAKKFGTTASTVHRRLLEANVSMRDTQGRPAYKE